MKKSYYKKATSIRRHYFLFKINTGEKESIFKVATKVRYARKKVMIVLTEDNAKRAIDNKGYGNSQTCVMATCVKSQAEVFPHPVDGYVDWTYNRAYVVSKVDKKTGLPSECVVYRHEDKTAKNFDSDKEEGLIELWKDLRDNGSREVQLHPITSRDGEFAETKKRKRNPLDKKRKRNTPHKIQPKGANLRFGIAKLGLT